MTAKPPRGYFIVRRNPEYTMISFYGLNLNPGQSQIVNGQNEIDYLTAHGWEQIENIEYPPNAPKRIVPMKKG